VSSARRRKGSARDGVVTAVPLGGLGEIGKNMMAVEYGGRIIVIDSGLAFPEEDMLGIDIVIPDMSYLLERKEQVEALILTHGHEDHIGGLPYFLQNFDVPVLGTRLTLGLAEGKIEEHGLSLGDRARVVEPASRVGLGPFEITFFRVNHSIADCVGMGIKTPVGTLVHSGDFKFDQTPVDGKVTGYHELAELGRDGVLALFSDSTNAELPGFTSSERTVGDTLDRVFRTAGGRVIVATFATNVHRIQQVINAAVEHGRRVSVVGRSMENVVEVATRLGYLEAPDGVVVDIDELNGLPPSRVAVLTTGSQGEPMSALTRMSLSNHKKVEIVDGDTVILAATPVPGNEKLVQRTVDHLFRLGAEVVYGPFSGVHVSGHASQEELKLMLNLVKPRYFVPIHGEYRHLVRHAELAESMGIPRERILVAENGAVFEFSRDSGRIAGSVEAGNVLVDGLGVGDVGNVVLRDRRLLSQDGILIAVVAIDEASRELVSGPDVISRGFVYMRESERLLDEARDRVKEAVEECLERGATDWGAIKGEVRQALSKYLYEETKRRPMVLPIIVEV